jgi:hypothetical protein
VLLAALDIRALPGLILGADPWLLLLLLPRSSPSGCSRPIAGSCCCARTRPASGSAPSSGSLHQQLSGRLSPWGFGIDALRVHGLSRYTRDLPLALSSLVIERIFGLLGMFTLVPIGF